MRLYTIFEEGIFLYRYKKIATTAKQIEKIRYANLKKNINLATTKLKLMPQAKS